MLALTARAKIKRCSLHKPRPSVFAVYCPQIDHVPEPPSPRHAVHRDVELGHEGDVGSWSRERRGRAARTAQVASRFSTWHVRPYARGMWESLVETSP